MFTANGQTLLSGTVTMPRLGAWTADLRCGAETAEAFPTGAHVDLELNGGLSLSGTAFRAGEAFASSSLRMVGGAGGLGTLASAKSYQGVTLGLVLGDLLAYGSEKLAPSSDAGLLARGVRRWMTTNQPAGTEIASLLADIPGALWRVLADGTVWVGFDSWPVVDAEHTVMRQDPEHARLELGTTSQTLIPGVTFLGLQVVSVHHHFSPASVGTTLFYEPA